jgi:hypothetical protein
VRRLEALLGVRGAVSMPSLPVLSSASIDVADPAKVYPSQKQVAAKIFDVLTRDFCHGTQTLKDR